MKPLRFNNILLTFILSIFGGIVGFVLIYLFTGTILIKDRFESPHSLVLDYYSHINSENKSNSSNNESFFTNASWSFQPNFGVDFTTAAENVVPAVVHIKTTYNAPNYTLYDFIFGTQPRHTTPVMSAGSGVIISSDGYIVTNNHVIENAEIIEVILNNRRTLTASLIGRDATTDLALLKVESTNLPHVKYGNSDFIRIGEWVLAVGNPFNLTSTATHGIISAKARNLNILTDNLAIESFIQTDAAVNPGNSGGALVNINGELIGINTAIASRTGSFVGYSFAIPVNIVRKVVADLVEFGEVQRAYLGIDVVDIDSKIASELNIKDIEGVYISRLWETGAARLAGIREADIILEVNSHKVNTSSQLLEQLSKYRPGDKVEFLIKRNGFTRHFTATLQNKYGNTELIRSEIVEKLSARFEPITEMDKQRLRITHGVQVSDIYRGILAANGVRKGFIIMFVNKKAINTVSDLKNQLENPDGKIFIEGVYPNGARAYYAFNI